MKKLPTALALALAALLAALALPSSAQEDPENQYNHFRLEGELLGHEVQPFTAPGPPGAGQEPVCLLRIKPYFHFAAPEWTEVFVWMQGGASDECQEWGKSRKGARVIVDGYLASYEIDGETVSAVKPLHLSVTDQP